MRKYICIFLIFMSAICSAENTEPIYIVDGKVVESLAEMPLPEEVAQATILNSKEAEEKYGERASEGVVVITTKKYAREQQAQKKSAPTAKQKKRHNSSSGIARLIGMILVIFVAFMQKPIKKLASKIQKRINNNRGVTARSYDPGVFDPEGVRFSASERIGNYISVAFFLILAALVGWLLVHLTRPDTYQHPDEKGVYIFIIVFFVGLLGYFIFCVVTFSKLLKCYLIIDEKGIRGVCAETIGLRHVLRNVDIRWEQVGKAKMMSPISIEFFRKGLKLPDHFEDFAELAEVEGIEQGTCCVDLTFFPANKVKDAVNFFYARYQSQHPDEQLAAKKKSYLLPPQKDSDQLYYWIVVIILILIGVLVAVLPSLV